MKYNTVTCILFILFTCLFFAHCNNGIDSPARKDTPPGNHAEDSADASEQYMKNFDVVGASEQKQQLVKKYNNLLVFHADDTMEVNKTYIATLALAKNADIEKLSLKVLEASDASGKNVITDTTIQIGKRMRARLLDLSPRNDRSFDITPISPDEQNLISKTKEAYWQWNVEPLKEGNRELKLSVVVIMNDEESFGLPAKDIPVLIFAKKASFINRVGNFFSKYWQWVITGIFVPIIIAWFTTWFKQRAEQKKKNS